MSTALSQIGFVGRVRRTRRSPTTAYRPLVRTTAIVAVIGGFLALLFVAGFQSVLVSGQHDVDTLQARLNAGREQGQTLRMEVARLESPDRILKVAKGRLGMVPPPTRIYLEAVLPGDPFRPLPPPGDDPFGSCLLYTSDAADE